MEAGGKDCEDETLQTAFKKLRVDAESLPGVSVEASRSGPEASGAKPKLSCSKDNWHGCMRKTSRGASRTQRRRRSKSPVLQPPKFSYCGSVSPPSGCLKHQRLATTTATTSSPGPTLGPALAQKELSSVGTAGSISPLVFGSSPPLPTSHQKIPAAVITKKGVSRAGEGEESRSLEPSACDEAKPLICAGAEASDFRALSELHSTSIAPPSSSETTPLVCSCAWVQNASDAPNEEAENDVTTGEKAEKGPELPCTCHQANQASWPGVEVYSFTGLRGVISECERNLPPPQEDTSRTLGSSNGNANAAATNPSVNVTAAGATNARSCSEQARVSYVDDITIEDLSGYMEYYLYMPKKMSHMAEMMYT